MQYSNVSPQPFFSLFFCLDRGEKKTPLAYLLCQTDLAVAFTSRSFNSALSYWLTFTLWSGLLFSSLVPFPMLSLYLIQSSRPYHSLLMGRAKLQLFWCFAGETGVRLEKKMTCRLRWLIQISIAKWKDWQTVGKSICEVDDDDLCFAGVRLLSRSIFTQNWSVYLSFRHWTGCYGANQEWSASYVYYYYLKIAANHFSHFYLIMFSFFWYKKCELRSNGSFYY